MVKGNGFGAVGRGWPEGQEFDANCHQCVPEIFFFFKSDAIAVAGQCWSETEQIELFLFLCVFVHESILHSGHFYLTYIH